MIKVKKFVLVLKVQMLFQPSSSLLRKDNWRGQESVAKALKHLIRDADAATLNQLVDLLLENEPKSKSHVIMLLGYLLSVASHEDLVQEIGTVNFSSRRVDFNGCSNSDTNGCKTCKILTWLFKLRPPLDAKHAKFAQVARYCMKIIMREADFL